MKLQDVRDLERAEIEALRKAARRQGRRDRKAARQAAWAARWPRWTAWWEARARELKIAATVVGSAVAIFAGVPVLWRNAGAIWRQAGVTWRHTGGALIASWRARDGERTALPPPTGAPSTALDFPKTAARPAPPDSPRPVTPNTKD